MIPVTKLDLSWLSLPPLQKVLACLTPQAGQMSALIVGGAVRDAVWGQATPPEDIDIATILTPDQVTACALDAGIAVHPTGLAHGTVTLVCDHAVFQVTTLRRDVATDGRHAVVAYTTDWAEDAARRDFTMNTLLMDADGQVYDPLGQGMKHIQSSQIVFVGDPRQRLQEDALRLLRFYRFWARYGQVDSGPSSAVKRDLRNAAPLLQRLSVERISAEFTKILATESAPDILLKMFNNNVLVDYPRHKSWQSRLRRAVAVAGSSALRYWALLPNDLTYNKHYLMMTRHLRQALHAYQAGWQILKKGRFSARAVRICAYHHGTSIAYDLCQFAGKGHTYVPHTLPVFCVRAADIQGIRPDIIGPALGQALQQVEARWIASDFTLNKAALLRPFRVRGQ